MKHGWISLLLLMLTNFSAGAVSAWQEISPDIPLGLPVDSRCTLSVSASVIDYGNQSRWQLQDAASGQVTPGKRTLMLSVVCPYTQPFKLALRSDLRYGAQGKINVSLSQAQLDGQSIQLASTSMNGILDDSPVESLRLQSGSRFAAVQHGRLATGKSLTLRMEIEPLLAESDTRVSAHQSNEATLTLELID